jgi:hypothetical protein
MLTRNDLTRVSSRMLVMVADDDEVMLEHVIELYRAAPNSELAIVPGTSPGLLVEKPLAVQHDHRGLPRDRPIPTVAPIRRATQSRMVAGAATPPPPHPARLGNPTFVIPLVPAGVRLPLVSSWVSPRGKRHGQEYERRRPPTPEVEL